MSMAARTISTVVSRRHAQRRGQQFGVRLRVGRLLTRTRPGSTDRARDLRLTDQDDQREETCRDRSAATGCLTMSGAGGRLRVLALVCGALIATGSPAFALKIPIQAYLTGARRGAANNSPAKGAHGRDFRHRHQHARMDGHLFGPVGRRRSAPISTGLSPISGSRRRRMRRSRSERPAISRARSTASPRSTTRRPRTSRTDASTSTFTRQRFPAGEIRGPVVRR